MAWICSVCGKTFHDKSFLICHKIYHIQEPVECNTCSKMCKNQLNLQNMHKRTHVISNDFHCTICNKSFFQQKTLIDHKKLHTEKKGLCQNCEKSFARGDYLKNTWHHFYLKQKCILKVIHQTLDSFLENVKQLWAKNVICAAKSLKMKALYNDTWVLFIIKIKVHKTM